MPPKFYTLSRLLQVATWGVILAAPVVSLLFVGYFGPQNLPSPLSVYPKANIVSSWQMWGVFAARAVPGLAMLYTLWKMAGLFGAFRRGEVLSETSAGFVAQIGRGLVALAVLIILCGPVQTVMATLNNPPGSVSLEIGLSGLDIWFLIAGGLLVLIGYALREAVRVQTENRGFV